LQRQAVLNMAYSLYEVLSGKIYQVRGSDLANISFIKVDIGWIVFDPLTVKEMAAAALKFINEQIGEGPVVAAVYSDSHGDHFGGGQSHTESDCVRNSRKRHPDGFRHTSGTDIVVCWCKSSGCGFGRCPLCGRTDQFFLDWNMVPGLSCSLWPGLYPSFAEPKTGSGINNYRVASAEFMEFYSSR
jgi:hypothetical protein